MNACLSLVFSILELLSIFGRLDARCVLYIKAGAASMPVRHVHGSKTGRCVVYTHPLLTHSLVLVLVCILWLDDSKGIPLVSYL